MEATTAARTGGAPLDMFRKGDAVRVRYRGEVLRGVWVFGRVYADGTVALRLTGRSAWRSLDASELELIDHDAKWPTDNGGDAA